MCLQWLTCHVAAPLRGHGRAGKVNVPVRLAQQVEVLQPSGSRDVGRPASDVGLVAPVLDVELDGVPGQFAEVAFQLVLEHLFQLSRWSAELNCFHKDREVTGSIPISTPVLNPFDLIGRLVDWWLGLWSFAKSRQSIFLFFLQLVVVLGLSSSC